LILIKGSRGMKLETLVEFIWESSSEFTIPWYYRSMFASNFKGLKILG
jgi:hypothetical protein